MKRTITFLTLFLALIGTSLQAQNLSTTRVQRQHGPTRFQKDHLKQTEASLLLSLDSTWQGDRRVAIQTLRYLEQSFPSYEFAAMIKPLERLLKDENADPIARKLAALALDELHSDAADAVIRDVSLVCEDSGLRTLCEALQTGFSTSEQASSGE